MSNNATDTSTNVVDAVTLSREELLVIMRILNTPKLLGFDLDWLQLTPGGTVTPETKQSLDAAMQSLFANGHLSKQTSLQDGREMIAVTNVLTALIGTSAYSEKTVLISLTTQQGKYTLAIHRLRDMVVMHAIAHPHIHRLAFLHAEEQMYETIAKLLDIQSNTPPSQLSANLPVEHTMQARQAIKQGDTAQAIALFVSSGLTPEQAQTLSHHLQHATKIGAMAILVPDTEEQWAYNELTACALVVSPTACVTFESDDAESPLMHVALKGRADLQTWIANYFPFPQYL